MMNGLSCNDVSGVSRSGRRRPGALALILMLADGVSYSAIEAAVPCYRDYINRWRRRFLEGRLDGLQARYRGQPPTVLTPAMEARILEQTRQACAYRQVDTA